MQQIFNMRKLKQSWIWHQTASVGEAPISGSVEYPFIDITPRSTDLERLEAILWCINY